MPPDEEHRDFGRLWDMLTSAREAVSFIEGMTVRQYQVDLKTQRATERSIEILGEAASQVSATFRSEHPEIPWASTKRRRNLIAHEYGDIKAEVIWRVAHAELPALIRQLERLLSSSE